jgi:hypothetical protein
MKKVNWVLPIQTEEFFEELNMMLQKKPFVVYTVGTKTLDGDYVSIDLFLDKQAGPDFGFSDDEMVLLIGTAIGSFAALYDLKYENDDEMKKIFAGIMADLAQDAANDGQSFEPCGENPCTCQEALDLIEAMMESENMHEFAAEHKESPYYEALQAILENYKK